MINVVNNFGKNAGKIWAVLNDNGPLTREGILKKTRLKENDFYAGLGWLARENKICKTGSRYELRETNLTDLIGGYAGKIWNTLSTQEDIDISTIAKTTQIPVRDAYSAIGWLARENKLKITKNKTTNQQLIFSLKR